jgi:hypothetical protein
VEADGRRSAARRKTAWLGDNYETERRRESAAGDIFSKLGANIYDIEIEPRRPL